MMAGHKHTGKAKAGKGHSMKSAPKDGFAHSSHHEMNKKHMTPGGFRPPEMQQCGPDSSSDGMPCNEEHSSTGHNAPDSHDEDGD